MLEAVVWVKLVVIPSAKPVQLTRVGDALLMPIAFGVLAPL